MYAFLCFRVLRSVESKSIRPDPVTHGPDGQRDARRLALNG